MTELKREVGFNPRSMLDFGSGPGTAALAVWDVWGKEGGKIVDDDGEEIWEEGEQERPTTVVLCRGRATSRVILPAIVVGGAGCVGERGLLLRERHAIGKGV